MLWVMRFVVMLTNVTIVNYPHVTQGAVVLEASFGTGAGEQSIPAVQCSVKGRLTDQGKLIRKILRRICHFRASHGGFS